MLSRVALRSMGGTFGALEVASGKFTLETLRARCLQGRGVEPRE